MLCHFKLTWRPGGVKPKTMILVPAGYPLNRQIKKQDWLESG